MENYVKNNEILAQYLGYKESSETVQEFMDEPEKYGKYYERTKGVHEYLDFHKSWDWLMEVVDKLEREGHPVYISSNNCSIYWSTNAINNKEFIVDQYGENKMDAVYRAVVLFVKYLNSNMND